MHDCRRAHRPVQPGRVRHQPGQCPVPVPCALCPVPCAFCTVPCALCLCPVPFVTRVVQLCDAITPCKHDANTMQTRTAGPYPWLYAYQPPPRNYIICPYHRRSGKRTSPSTSKERPVNAKL